MSSWPDVIRSRFPQSSFGRNVLALAGSTALAQGLAVLASPILTRLYSVADFGLFQSYLVILLFILVIAAGRYELAIVMPEDDQLAVDLTVLSLLLAGATSLVVGAAVMIATVARVLPDALIRMQGYLWMLPFSLLGAACCTILNQFVLRQKNFSLVARSKLLQGTGMVAVQMGLGATLHGGPLGLIVGDSIGRIAGTWSFAQSAWRQQGALFRRTRWIDLKSAAYRFRQFPLISGFSALVNSAGFAFPPLMIGSLYSPSIVGWYAITERVMGVPVSLLGTAIAQVYTVDAARLANSDPVQLRHLFCRTLRRMAWLGIVPFALIIVGGETLFGVVFGPEWREAGRYARPLASMSYIGFVVWPVLPTLNLLERQTWQLGWDLGRLALTMGALFLAYFLQWTPYGAIVAYSTAMLLGYALHPVLSLHAISLRQAAADRLKP